MALPPIDTRGLAPITRLRASIVNRQVAARNRRAEAALERIPHVKNALREYGRKSEVTGASMSDYLTLYQEVRARNPRETLELGTGVSTVVLAHAVLDNAAEGGALARITSMEEDAEWTAKAKEYLPADVAHAVDIVHSPKVDGVYKIFRGVQYETIPRRAYDFVFSDGPQRTSPVTGDNLFDLDLIQIVRQSETPVNAVVDDHFLTFYVLQKVFGTKLARYSASHRLMFVGPVTKQDVRHFKKENFIPDLRILGHTELKLRMATD